MLDVRFVRENPELVAKAVADKGEQANLEEFLQMDRRRRELLQEVEELKYQRNTVSKEIGRLKKAGEEQKEMMDKMRLSNERIRTLDEELRELDKRLEDLLLGIPNLPDPDVPVGAMEEDNVEVRRCRASTV